MKSILPVLTFAVLLTSCSSVYKSGQTPDDVYFSPARPQDEYARVEKKNDRMYRNQYDDYTLEDQYLRMKTRNRRYELLDDGYDSYAYGNSYNSYNSYNNYYRMNMYYGGHYNPAWWSLNYGFSNYYYSPYHYNPYYYNPYYGNPYYNGIVYGNVSPVYNKPRTTNLNMYNGNGGGYYNSDGKGKSRTFNTYSSGNEDGYRNSGSNAGGFLRNVFGSGNSNSSNPSTTTSTQSSSSSSSSGSSGSSSGGSSRAPVRRF